MTGMTILKQLPLTSADIGRFHAPDHIKDRAGWGRRWVAKMVDAGQVFVDKTGMVRNQRQKTWAQVFYASLACPNPRDYRAPHANRGTRPRPHKPRVPHTRQMFHV